MAAFGSLKQRIFDKEARKQYVSLPHSLLFTLLQLSYSMKYDNLIPLEQKTGNIKLMYGGLMPTIATRSFWTITVSN